MSKITFFTAAAAAAVLALAAPALAQPRTTPAGAFLATAIKGDNSEIMLGQLAEQRGATARTRQFGQALVRDHTQARDQAMALARGMGMTVPMRPMAKALAERQRLDGLSGRAFDREFARYMVKDHQQDIGKFGAEARSHNRAAQLARATIPTLRKHLQMARNIQRTEG